jgi:serine/threonine protein kinase
MVNGSIPAIGDEIAGHRIVRAVGEGSMGVVYEARSPSGEPRALKVLRPGLDAERIAEFEDEIRATGSLRHENVVAIHDHGVDHGHRYLIMEFVDGPSLDALLGARKRLPWKTATRIVVQVARALGHAHAQGLVHRDVKPANLLLYRDGRARLGDFGIVKDIGSLRGFLLRGRRVATPTYASPEQCLDKRLSEATDMYSLGATFYHAVCGRPPFTGESAKEIAARHVPTPPQPPVEIVPEIPRALGKTIERMLAKRQTDRVPSMDRLVHDLEHILSGRVAIAVNQPAVNGEALKGLRHVPRSSRFRRTAG